MATPPWTAFSSPTLPLQGRARPVPNPQAGEGAGRIPKPIAAPARQTTASREACYALRQRRGPGQAVAQIEEPWKACRHGRITRQVADQSCVQRKASLCGPRCQDLDLHARHVDAGWAFAAARLAGDAEFHGVRHLVGREGVSAKLTG